MKTYRIKTDIKHPLFFIPKGTISCRTEPQYVYFKTSTGSEFALLRKDLKEDNEWVEEVKEEQERFNTSRDYYNEFMAKHKKEGACFTHEDLKEAFEAARDMQPSDDLPFGLKYKYFLFEDYLKSKQ